MPGYTLPCMLEMDTRSLGKKIGSVMFPGAFVAMYGDLGTGKTTFVRAIAQGMGVDSLIVSPSYTIVTEYMGTKLPLFHFDAYRIESIEELTETGYFDYCYRNGVVIVEWANKIKDALPRERLDIHITGSGRQSRTMLFSPHGSAYTDVLKETVI